jgi:hypothetical protein
VDGPAVFSDREIAFLEALDREGVDFMIVGLGAAALLGAPAITQDVDLWFSDLGDPGIRRALASVGGAYVAPTSSSPPMFVGRAVALFDVVTTMHGLDDFAREARRATVVPIGDASVKVLPLERIIASKRALDRPKDRLVLPVLEDAVRARDIRSVRGRTKVGAKSRTPDRRKR